MREGVWGDVARSFVVESGCWTPRPKAESFARGTEVQRSLHEAMQTFVSPETTFEELFDFANGQIKRCGFENLDFLGNVGHSLESSREARRYIALGNGQRLGDAGLFTFEPHIRERGSRWGFKHEDVYYFDGGGYAVTL
jgi:hypothetical protein